MNLKMTDWFLFALIALLMYGLWGFFPKVAIKYISPKSILIYEVVGGLIIGLIVLFYIGFKPEIHTKGITFAILTGIAGAIGTLFFFFALLRGKLSVVVTMTALYPVVTILLAFIILQEPVTLKQGIGIIFALVAIVLLST